MSKKYNLKVETYSLLHIGSGNTLYEGYDFVVNDKLLYLIDLNKLAQKLGPSKTKQFAEIISTSPIDKLNGKKFEDILKRLDRGIKKNDYTNDCRTLILNADIEYGKIKSIKTIKEFINDGKGIPYIPASSIKGALRVAYLETIIDEADLEKKLSGIREKEELKEKITEIEYSYFGKPNADIFRFLQISDAILEEDTPQTYITNFAVLSRGKLGASQYIECISEEENFNSSIVFKDEYLRRCQQYSNLWGEENPPKNTLDNILNIFKKVNSHTKTLVEKEIEYYKEINTNCNDLIKNCIDELENIQEYIKKTKENECFIRLGQGVGYNFITGSIARKYNKFDEKIVPLIKNKKHKKYNQGEYPRSRRINKSESEYSHLLGFVKLKLLQD